MENIQNRIKQIVEIKYNNTPSRMAEALDVNQGGFSTMIKGNTSPNSNVVIKILSLHPEISAEWLMRGKGEMESQQIQPIQLVELEGLKGKINDLEKLNNLLTISVEDKTEIVENLRLRLRLKDAKINELEEVVNKLK